MLLPSGNLCRFNLTGSIRILPVHDKLIIYKIIAQNCLIKFFTVPFWFIRTWHLCLMIAVEIFMKKNSNLTGLLTHQVDFKPVPNFLFCFLFYNFYLIWKSVNILYLFLVYNNTIGLSLVLFTNVTYYFWNYMTLFQQQQ